ncbi:asparagine synthase C-terminal domain-containing protein [Helicobacter typhlonius]|uniref:asparagine synthase C-terminal domain-containing protein n=1 Tax=Helicobacter typhlonius TaxID=76936 RepID=UPI002FE141A3
MGTSDSILDDKVYCMSHYLAFRYVADESRNFFPHLSHRNLVLDSTIDTIADAKGLDSYIAKKMQGLNPNSTGIMLSGGIDSAIVASYLPKGAKAFTLKCIGSPNAIDETENAHRYAEYYGLEHIVVPVYWEDVVARLPDIFAFDGVPCHSIEPLIDIALSTAKRLGIDTMCVGESFDLVFGGMDKLLAKDWGFDEFVERYTFLEPSLALKSYVDTKCMFEPYRLGNKIDFLRFMDEVFAIESSTSYWHMFQKNNMRYLDPAQKVRMSAPLDLYRIRNGEPKYIVRELFSMRYKGMEIPNKIPMPREVDYWLRDYEPKRDEFLLSPNIQLSGDQKWQLFCLEQFLNIFDPK